MDSKSEEDILCSICSESCKNPVILSCDHNFCQDCSWKFWKDKQTPECPQCKSKRRNSAELPPEFTLKTECEVTELPCNLHSEKLSFFCLDDQQLVCSVCRDSETHIKHRFQPVDEAGQELKKQLQNSLKSFKKKLRCIRQVKGECDENTDHIKAQTENTLRTIKKEFRRLHQFLDEEEEARLAALREEEQQKSQMMKEKITALSQEMSALLEIIKNTEKQLKTQNVFFLQSYKETVERVQQPLPEDPQVVSGALIDVAKHLGNLSFNIWFKMKEMVSYSPVILDPNTAHPDVTLSEDLTSLKQGEGKQEVPDNPERIDHFFSVMGSEGFNSGRHSWEVEVGDNTGYVLGVNPESKSRKGVLSSTLFRLMFCQGEFKTLSPSDIGTDVSVKNLRKVRVLLDYDRGQLSFLDAETDTHIHTFTHTFTERMFPYISTWSNVPIKVTARKVSVAVEQHL